MLYMDFDGSIPHIIKDRNWIEFIKLRESAVVPVVRWFYSNAVEREGKFYVRGKIVPFDRKAVNAFYKFPDIDNDGYSTYLSKQLDLDEVIQVLCRPWTEWKMSNGERE